MFSLHNKCLPLGPEKASSNDKPVLMISIPRAQILVSNYYFPLEGTTVLGELFDSRAKTGNVQNKPRTSYLKARELPKTIGIMSKGHMSQLKDAPTGYIYPVEYYSAIKRKKSSH